MKNKMEIKKNDKKPMKYKNIAILSILIAFLLLCSLSTTSAVNQTINSTSTGGIAQGITDTGTGETLFLQPGTYNKTNQDTNITINKNITIQGNGSTDSVIIDAQSLSRIFTIANNTNVTFINVTFINGFVSGTNTGGGILCNYSSSIITVMNCSFINNSAYYGGAIRNDGNLTIHESNFTANTAGQSGGAIYNVATGSVIGSIFTNNKANNYGGAIRNDGNLTIHESNCTDNAVSVTGGGALYSVSAITSVYKSNFASNNASIGGAIHINGGNVIITECNFNDNTAVGGYGGGAILNHNYGNTTVSKSNFTNNKAVNYGGAIHNEWRSNITVISSNFVSNNADIGGAIFNNNTMLVSGNTMSGNTAITLGNVIYNNGTMGILNLTFIDNSTWIVKNGSTITLNATLTDDMGNTVTWQNISFYLNGVFFENLTSIEGYANITYTPSTTGDIPISGLYVGSGTYDILINNGLLQVRIPTNITISVPEEVKVDETVTLESTLTDEDGNPIANATVDFYVGGVKVGSGVTDSKGVGKLNYTFNKAGKPNIVAKFEGDDTYLASNATNTTSVSKIATDITISLPDEVKVDETVTLESTLTDEDGNPIANATVDFYVDGVKIGSAVTDSNGVAKLKYTFTKAGKPKITAKYAGNDTYIVSTANEQTKVSKILTRLKIEKKGNKIIATLTDENGNPIVGKEVTIKDSKGRVLGIGFTDENGQFIITYEGSAVNFKASFNGDDTYQASSATLSIGSEDTANATNDPVGIATMKNTGIPIIAVLLVLLSALGVVFKRK